MLGFHWAEFAIPVLALVILALLVFSIRAFVRGMRRGMRSDA